MLLLCFVAPKVQLIQVDPINVFYRPGHDSVANPDVITMLRNSIRFSGLHQPVRVAAIDGRRYRIVDGERRMSAIYGLLNSGFSLTSIPCLLVTFESPAEELMDRFISNLHRCSDVADMQRTLRELMSLEVTPGQIAAQSGVPLSVLLSILGDSTPLPVPSTIPTPQPSFASMQELLGAISEMRSSIYGGARLLQVLRTAYDFSLGLMTLQVAVHTLQRTTDE